MGYPIQGCCCCCCFHRRKLISKFILQLEELHILVSEAQEPSASLACFERLRNKLEAARELNISQDQLQNSQGALERLEHRMKVFFLSFPLPLLVRIAAAQCTNFHVHKD